MAITLDQLIATCSRPQETYLSREMAICYIVNALFKQDSFGTELLNALPSQSPHLRVSDTILYAAIQWLEENEIITSYQQKVPGRGRPRRMLKLAATHTKIKTLSECWHQYLGSQPTQRQAG